MQQLPPYSTSGKGALHKAALLWSGGKDSILALHYARRGPPDLQVFKLVTCLSSAYDRVSMHGVRRRLIEDQAAALGLAVDFVAIPHLEDPACPVTASTPGTTFPPNDVYTPTMLAAFARLKDEGIETIIFGDIFLEDLRAFRERLLSQAGLEGCYPLWGRGSAELYDEFVSLGFQAVVVCVDRQRLSEEHCGKLLDRHFRESLPAEVDPCGERGEYHSFTFAGPLFRHPVLFHLGGLHRQEPFAFQELYPGEQPMSPAPTVRASSRGTPAPTGQDPALTDSSSARP
jgi:uncharacterized protein (TIGR00290 family)